jgi:hypothetical protein
MFRLRDFLAIAAIGLLIGVSAVAAQEPTPSVPAQYSATAFGQSGAVAGKSFGINVYIDQTSTKEEVQELLGVLQSKGQDGLVSALEKMKDKGRVAPTGSTGNGMKVVTIRPTANGGQHIVLATNRWVTFTELINATRSRDYPIGIVVLDVDKDGNGTGSFAPLNKVKFNKAKELVIEHYGQKPFRLANVKREK